MFPSSDLVVSSGCAPGVVGAEPVVAAAMMSRGIIGIGGDPLAEGAAVDTAGSTPGAPVMLSLDAVAVVRGR